MGKQTIRTKEEKLAIVKRHLGGEAGRALEWETGIRHEQIRNWTAKYHAEGEAGLEPKKKPGNPLSRYERRKELTYEEHLRYQIERLKRELLKKEAEVQRLKNTTHEGGRYPKKMIQQMYAEIQRQTDKHSLTELCSVYGVSRSGYYNWLGRAGAMNQYERTQQRMDVCVADIHAHYPMMGCRQIRDTLEWRFGWKLSDPTVWRSMKRLGNHGYTRKRKLPTSYTGMEHTRYANILGQNFQSHKPFQKIVTDVTYIKYRGKWFYLAAYLDLFNNEIIEWELGKTFDNFLVMRPAERLLKKAERT